MAAHTPIPYLKSNTLIRKYVEPFTDEAGNNADITYVDYTDKKGNLHEKYAMYVKWRDK